MYSSSRLLIYCNGYSISTIAISGVRGGNSGVLSLPPPTKIGLKLINLRIFIRYFNLELYIQITFVHVIRSSYKKRVDLLNKR